MRIGLLAALLAAVALGLVSTSGSPGAAAQDGAPPPGCAAATGRPGADQAALTVYPDVPLYAEQFGEARVAGPLLAFRTRVTKLPGARKGDRVLVKVADGAQCGFIQASKILDGPALKVSDIDPDEKVQAGLFGYVRNHWTIKAMLRSNPKLDTTAHEATLFDAPGGEGKPYKSTCLLYTSPSPRDS